MKRYIKIVKLHRLRCFDLENDVLLLAWLEIVHRLSVLHYLLRNADLHIHPHLHFSTTSYMWIYVCCLGASDQNNVYWTDLVFKDKKVVLWPLTSSSRALFLQKHNIHHCPHRRRSCTAHTASSPTTTVAFTSMEWAAHIHTGSCVYSSEMNMAAQDLHLGSG